MNDTKIFETLEEIDVTYLPEFYRESNELDLEDELERIESNFQKEIKRLMNSREKKK